LDRALCLLLHHDGPGSHAGTVADITDTQLNQVTGAQFTIDGEIEKCQLSTTAGKFRRTRIAQISLSFSGAFWPTIFPLFHGSRLTAAQ